MTSELSLPVVEMFGPTIQGEGPFAGRAADFVRLGGCNLTCSWCDTPYSWDGRRFDLRKEITPTTVDEIVDWLSPRHGLVVLTGGEPLLHARTAAFRSLLAAIARLGRPVHVETNGTILPTAEIADLVGVFVVSPKLPNARLRTSSGASAPADGWAAVETHARVFLKIVCETVDDVAAAVRLAQGLGFGAESVWVMPQATDRQTLDARWPVIAEAAAAAGVNATSRLHLLAWGDERGR